MNNFKKYERLDIVFDCKGEEKILTIKSESKNLSGNTKLNISIAKKD